MIPIKIAVRVPQRVRVKACCIPVPNKRHHEVDMKEVEKLLEILREADSNKDRRYNKDELKHALKNLGAMFPTWRAYRCLQNADEDHDGQISGDEIDTLIEYLFSLGFGI